MNSVANRPKAAGQALGGLEGAQIIRRADEPHMPGRADRWPSPQVRVHPTLLRATEAPVQFAMPLGEGISGISGIFRRADDIILALATGTRFGFDEGQRGTVSGGTRFVRDAARREG